MPEDTARLGHRYIGCEHLLLALVGVDPASAVLRERGLTPAASRRKSSAGPGPGPGRACSPTSTGPRWPRSGSISTPCGPGSTRPSARTRDPGRPGRPPDAPPPGPARGRLIHRWRHRARVRRVPPVRAVAPAPEGRYQAADQPAGHIPFTPGAKKCLESTLREAVAQHQARHRCRAPRARPARHEPGAGTSHPGRGRPVRPGVAGRDPGPLPPGKLTSGAAIVAPGPARGSLLFIRSGDAE